MIALLAVPVLVFLIENEKFFDVAIQQMRDGATCTMLAHNLPTPKPNLFRGGYANPKRASVATNTLSGG